MRLGQSELRENFNGGFILYSYFRFPSRAQNSVFLHVLHILILLELLQSTSYFQVALTVL